jgi:hypothetical protein
MDLRELKNILLTFDVEDFINPRSTKALEIILETLEKYDLKALFFITGHMAENLANFPDILDMLKTHEIGYHSSSHSVRPTILEYTDVESYEKAYLESLKRETIHINPYDGKIEGEGGIIFLRKLFPTKQITAYRAPGNCWSPPHFEALVRLGIRFDFSLDISSVPVYYKGVTFYPCPVFQHWKGTLSDYQILLYSLLKHNYAILDFHPSLYVYEGMWDSIYMYRDMQKLFAVRPLSQEKIKSLVARLDLLFHLFEEAKKMKTVEITSTLRKAKRKLQLTKSDVEKCYMSSMKWTESYFHYKPKFIRYHFLKYFNDCVTS